MPDPKRCGICGNLAVEKYKLDISDSDGYRTVVYFCEQDGRAISSRASTGSIVIKGIREEHAEVYRLDGKRVDQ